MEKSIELIDVTVGYFSETILKNFSFCAKKGQVIGLFGSNGAGKTTLLCAINRLARVSKGNIFIHGIPFTISNDITLRKKIGYVPQHFDVDARLPVLAEEVVLMGRYGKIGLFHFPAAKDRTSLHDISEKLEINHLLKKPFGHLSGGEKKRVLIGRALIQEPEILLLDEIFSWLDWKIQTKILHLINTITHEKQLTTLLVSHNPEILTKMCSRVVWMERGEIVFDGNTGNFLQTLGVV